MNASAILAIILGLMCFFLGIKIQDGNKVKIEVITQKKLKQNVENEYRQLHGRVFLLDSVLLLAYGALLIAKPVWVSFQVTIVYLLIIVIVNEGLRYLSRKYYV